MAAALGWTPELASGVRPHDEDSWHVELAPGEVKVLSLEQVDDLYRLEIIDESTRLWQPGMRGWTRLGIVAGIEPEPALARPAPQRAANKNAMIPPPPVEWPPSGWSGSLPVGPPAAAPRMAPPPPVIPRTPDSLRPLAIDDLPFIARKRSEGGWLVVLAVLCGLGITLYRNDILRQAAARYGQAGLYSRLETAVGGPGFGTLRSIEQPNPELFITTNALLPAPAPAKAPESVAPPTAPSKAEPPAAPTTKVATPPAPKDKETLAKAPAKSAAPPVPAAPKAAPPAAPKAAPPVAAKARPEPAPAQKAQAPSESATPKPSGNSLRDAIRRSATKSQRAKSESKDIGIKGTRNAYDPLNPNL